MKAKSTRGASTRQRILESAAKLVYRNGVNGTSVDDVLSASGTGKSQFYHYFTSKDALVRELIQFHLEAMPAAQEALLSQLGTPAGVFAWLGQIQADYQAGLYSDGCPIGNLASELAAQNEDLRLSLQSIFGHWEARLTAGLQQMKAKGQLRADVCPTSLATFCIAAIEGALLLAKTEKTGTPLAATVGQLKAHLQAQMLGASRRPSTIRRPGTLSFCP